MTMKLGEYLNMRGCLLFFADEKKKGSLKYYIKWYSERHPFYRIAYRVSGLLMIIFAFLTPFWVTGDKSGQAFLAGGGTIVVSIATFYSFKHAWSGYYLALYNLGVKRAVSRKNTEELH